MGHRRCSCLRSASSSGRRNALRLRVRLRKRDSQTLAKLSERITRSKQRKNIQRPSSFICSACSPWFICSLAAERQESIKADGIATIPQLLLTHRQPSTKAQKNLPRRRKKRSLNN